MPRNTRVTCTCENCGIEFHPWGSRETTSRFCGSKCNAQNLKRTISNTDEDFDKYLRQDGDCLVWMGPKLNRGYGLFIVKGRRVKAHRYAYERVYGAITPEQLVCHECDNPPCCNPAHLWLGTIQQNLADCVKKGRNKSKITRAEALAIRTDPRPQKDIAAQYGISATVVCGIKRGSRWKDV